MLNKKYHLLSVRPLAMVVVMFFCLTFFIFSGSAVQAIPSDIIQVKTKDSPVVYFLSHNYHIKKAYINETSYLSYNNRWSDIKTVTQGELDSWPDAKLFKINGSPAIYYIKNNQKTKILRPSDLEILGFISQPILTVTPDDLDQYRSISYDEIGLIGSNNSAANNDNNNSSSSSSEQHLLVFNDLATVSNKTLVTNTKNNIVGSFRFQAPADREATLTSISVRLGGIYNNEIVTNVTAQNATGKDYGANINWRSNERQVIITFRPALNIAAGQSATVTVLADLTTCTDCTNQTLRAELTNAAAVNSTLPVSPASGAWPLLAAQFSLLANNDTLGSIKVQEQTLQNSTSTVVNNSRLIGKFMIYENSGKENVVIKRLIFNNNGSASKNDWANFSLSANNQVIARATDVNSDGQIDFPINIFQIPKSSYAQLMITAGLKSDYNPKDTFDLSLYSLTATGQTYNLSLNAEINNITQSFPLN